jgi:hypothetical protein
MHMGLVEDGRFPLVVVNWPAGQLTDDVIEEALCGLTSFYDRRHAVLHDGLRVLGMNARQRRRFAAHTARHDAEIRSAVVASAAVVRSALLRGIIAMVQWLAPPPTPFATFRDQPQAEEWLLFALRREGLWRPPASRLAQP